MMGVFDRGRKQADMRILARGAWIVALLAAFSIHTSSGEAAEIRVSIFGSDSSSCGTDAYPFTPCRTLQYAINNRANSGDTVYLEWVGNYGPATIAKTIHIEGAVGTGIYAPAGVPCLTINGGPNDVVTVTGLVCDQAGAQRTGILFNSGSSLRLTAVTIRSGVTSCALRFQPNNNAELDFSDIAVSEWNGPAICLVPRSGADVAGVIGNARLHDHQYGLFSRADAGSEISVSCDDCYISGGGAGIHSNGANSTVRVKNSLISDNTLGLSRPNAGQIISNGGNSIIANTTDGTFSSTVLPLGPGL